jgi:formylglycine-generating enzyme required for sulfatase activity
MLSFGFLTQAQDLTDISFQQDQPFIVESFKTSGNQIQGNGVPIISFQLDSMHFSSPAQWEKNISVTIDENKDYIPGYKAMISFVNISEDTIKLHNVVPFGQSPDHVYITGKGDHYLSRTHLFRPGSKPVNVIVPDNAWELGYGAVTAEEINVCALVRRLSWSSNAKRKRFETILTPGDTVKYAFWADTYSGPWQNGLKKMFQERYLYDVEPGTFDNSMYEREDLTWIRKCYTGHLIMAWDEYFYDAGKGGYTLQEFLERGEGWYGGDHFIGIWPTWPILGLDQRNQWDLFRDLPGGLSRLKELSHQVQDNGTAFFIAYNPWDTDTRNEGHYSGMAAMIEAMDANGVVLDTRGSSSEPLQRAADSVKSGVVMYSEGMAVPKDMQNIVAGRVHNALYYPPMLNLNKFIKPDFSIFRVAELRYERIRREYALSLFNGYGTELNIYRAGRPAWIEEDYALLGKTSRILIENSSAFNDYGYTPLIPTLKDDIWVNRWETENKTLYTIFSLIPEGSLEPLFRADSEPGYHYIDLWNHENATLDSIDGLEYVVVDTEPFHQKYLGTNNEGAVSVIARFPELINFNLEQVDRLTVSAVKGQEIRLWAGDPSHNNHVVNLPVTGKEVNLTDLFGSYEGKYVLQLMDDGELLDEQVFEIPVSTPRLVSHSGKSQTSGKTPEGMVFIPAGTMFWETDQGDDFVPYPKYDEGKQLTFDEFYMDEFPVTNIQFFEFLEATDYTPGDDYHFLHHWTDGEIPEGMENMPVVYIAYEDARAYAAWAGKRLPTEQEWQYAAQAGDGDRLWPWGNTGSIERTEEVITNTLTVARLAGIDSTFCNTGNGTLDEVGKYPKGQNPHGLQDLVGSVWQITNDIYDNGSYRYIILKGGSYYYPGSSWWYVQGGPRPLNWRQMLLRVSPGFERNATVGFRCVKDVE